MTKPSTLKWHGGKSYLAKTIVANMPAHNRYCETHFGGGAVLFERDGEGVAEFVNDINRDLTNFWDVLRLWAKFVQFKQVCEASPFSDELFAACRTRLERPWKSPAAPASLDDVIERAHAFFVVNRQSRQGLGKCFATPTSRTRRGMNENVSAWLTAIEGLPEVHARLRRVEIRNQDALAFIAELDGDKTFFYVDPPYLHATRHKSATNAYQHEMSEADHAKLLDLLATIDGKFMLSGYPSEMYERHAAHHGWRCIEVEIDNKSSGVKVKEKKTECLWMNY